MLAPAARPAGRDEHDAKHRRENNAGKSEKEEEDLGVEGIGARNIEPGGQVVTDGGRTGQSSLVVASEALDGCKSRGRLRGQVVREGDVQLDVFGFGRGGSDRIDEAVPLVQRQEKNIVRRRLRATAASRAHCLKETICEGQVNDRVDSCLSVRQTGAPYHHDGAGLRVKVGSRLLGEQCTPSAQKVADFAWEFVTVTGLKSQDLAGACHLGRPAFGRS